MIKLIKDQAGVTLIETVVSTVIIAIILVTVIGALLFGQKMVVFSDSKNNEAAQAQELVDSIISMISAGTLPNELNVTVAKNVGTSFDDTLKLTQPKQYYITKVVREGKECYNIYVRVYYNNGESYIDLNAFAKMGGVFI